MSMPDIVRLVVQGRLPKVGDQLHLVECESIVLIKYGGWNEPICPPKSELHNVRGHSAPIPDKEWNIK